MAASGSNFNTKKVRLKLLRHLARFFTRVPFQYQKGAIKTLDDGRAIDGRLHFNTKKVRLKLCTTCACVHVLSIFQYQKGAIKTVP